MEPAPAQWAAPEPLRNRLYLPSLAERLNPSLSTPLASSFFDMLGVDKRTAMTAAVLAQFGGTISLGQFSALHEIYCTVLRYQVRGPQCCMQRG